MYEILNNLEESDEVIIPDDKKLFYKCGYKQYL